MNKTTVLASLLLALMAAFSFLHVIVPAAPLWVSGLCGWAALGLLFTLLPWRTFTQFLILSGIGGGLLCLAYAQTGNFPLQKLLEQNVTLLVMLYSVSFLRLVAVPEQQAKQPLPVGKWAFIQTMLGIHVLGAVINLSILVLAAGRYQAKGMLNQATVSLMGRTFSAAALWSPFFAAMGVTLTYAPHARLLEIMGYGLILTFVSLGVMLVMAGGWRLQRLDDFPGYPMQVGSLLVPVILAATVLLLHGVFPQVTVLSLVSIASLVLALLVLLMRDGRAARKPLAQHVNGAATRMARELSLFLGAGVLTLGLQGVLMNVGQLPWLQQFGGLEASLLVAAAIVVSMLGVHPVISIAVTGPLLLPLQPDITLMAVMFLSMWSLGVVASPFSGVNVMLRGQFGLSGRDLFTWNIRYVLVMWVVISLGFLGYAGW